MSEKIRCRNFDLLLYDEDETHKACLDKLATGYRYIAIKHDKDRWTEEDTLPEGVNIGDLKKPHWHVIIKFPQGRWNTAVAKDLGIAENYIQRCVSYEGSLLYLIHFGMPHKYQYLPQDCIGNLMKDLEKVIDRSSDLNERVMDVLDILDEKEHWTTRSFLEEACRRDRIGEALRLGGLIGALLAEHNCKDDFRVQKNAGAYKDAQDQARFQGFIEGYHSREI